MQLEIQASNKQLLGLVVSLVVVAGISYVYSQAPNPGHTWSELGNIPPDFADGVDDNTDTLAGISCAEGQLIKYSSGTWGCASDSAGTDYCSGGTCSGGLTLPNGADINVKNSDGTEYVHSSCSTWGCISSHVFTSPYYYSNTNSGTMYIGESGNTVNIRGQLSVGGSATVNRLNINCPSGWTNPGSITGGWNANWCISPAYSNKNWYDANADCATREARLCTPIELYWSGQDRTIYCNNPLWSSELYLLNNAILVGDYFCDDFNSRSLGNRQDYRCCLTVEY